MPTITMRYDFACFDGDVIKDRHTEHKDFDVCNGVDSETAEFAEEWLDEANTNWDDALGFEGEWALESLTVDEYDDDYGDPADFVDLDEYALYAELVEEFGEAFRMRHDDLGDLDGRQFQDSYYGCFEDEKDFAQSYSDSIGDIPDHLYRYIDWELFGSDLLMDFSTYEGSEGLHVFRD